MVHTTNLFDGNHDHSFIPWVLVITTFALWGLIKMLSFVFGGWRHHARAAAAAPPAAAGPGYGPGYGPGAGVNAGPVAAGAGAGAGVGVGRFHKPSRFVSDGLETLLWLLLIPTIINSLYGFDDRTARNLIIAIFVIGMLWALLRGLGHIPVLGFLHRIIDLALLALVPMAIAAAALGIRDHHPDIDHDD